MREMQAKNLVFVTQKVLIEPKLLCALRVFTSMRLNNSRHTLPGEAGMIYRLNRFAITLMLLVALSFTFERQAHAYVDPGSGLLLFQGISAAVSGALFLLPPPPQKSVRQVRTKVRAGSILALVVKQ